VESVNLFHPKLSTFSLTLSLTPVILGNAYLSQFFMTSSDPKLLKQSMSAYHQAERDSGAAKNPDLHFNKATVRIHFRGLCV
jgi:hypothetical protein